MKRQTEAGQEVWKGFRELYDLGREAERTLNGYINYVHKLKTGSESYGDRYIPAPDETPMSLKE